MPMRKRQISSDKEEKLACAQCFLQWYSQQQGVEYSLKETEEEFPELNGNTRWDFVASPKSGSNKLALEVKRIIRPNVRIQRSQWSGLLKQVNKKLQTILNGKFMITTPVRLHPPKGTKYHVLNIDGKARTQLVDVLVNVIRKYAPNMKLRETRNLGPEILQLFPAWPRRIKNACEFELRKTADGGSCIEMPGGIDGFWEEEALKEAIENLDMTSQLKLARQKDFKQTFLLLDLKSELPWSPDVVTKVLTDKSFGSPDVSSIYLVQVPAMVAEVWPAGEAPNKARNAVR